MSSDFSDPEETHQNEIAPEEQRLIITKIEVKEENATPELIDEQHKDKESEEEIQEAKEQPQNKKSNKKISKDHLKKKEGKLHKSTNHIEKSNIFMNREFNCKKREKKRQQKQKDDADDDSSTISDQQEGAPINYEEKNNHIISLSHNRKCHSDKAYQDKERLLLEEIDKLYGIISERDNEIQNLKEALKKKCEEDQQKKETKEKEKIKKIEEDAKLKLDIEDRIKKQQNLSQKHQELILNSKQLLQIWPINSIQQQIRINFSLNTQKLKDQIHNGYFYPHDNQTIQHEQYLQPLQNSPNETNYLSQYQPNWQQNNQMSSPENNTANSNIYFNLNPNTEAFTRLIKEKCLKENVQFFQNAVTVEEILNQEYSGNQKKRNELEQLFKQQNIEWVSTVRGDGNCFFRSLFISYLLVKMLNFIKSSNFSLEIQQFLSAISQIQILPLKGMDDFFGEDVDIKALVQFSLAYFSSKIVELKQQDAVISLINSLNDPIFDLAMQIISKSMIIKAVEEIIQKQISPLCEIIDISQIRSSILCFNTEGGSSEIYACLATYLDAQIILLNCANENKKEFQIYEPLPGIPKILMLKKIGNRTDSGYDQLALWLKTGHYYILFTKELADQLHKIYQNQRQ